MNYIFDVLPLLLLFVIFFMAFSFIETVILLAIKHYLRKYWVLFVDKLMRGVTFHKNLVRIAAVSSLVLLTCFMVLFTPLFDILIGGNDVIQFLGIILLIEMILIYIFSNREAAETTIEKRIHLYTFTLFSIIAYTSIMMMANQSYADFEHSVNRSLVYPVVRTIERNYEQQVEDRLMTVIREKVKDGECAFADYGDLEATPGIVQFAYVRDDLGLVESGYAEGEPIAEGQALRGLLCVHETKFMLTPEGKWYQVLEQTRE